MVQTLLSSWLSKKPGKLRPNNDCNDAASSHSSEPPAQQTCPLQTRAISTPIEQTLPTSTPASGLEGPSALPPNVQIRDINKDNLQSFRRLITLLLPVPYSDKFYSETISDTIASSISAVALWSDDIKQADADSSRAPAYQQQGVNPRVVAGIRCRLLSHSPAVDAFTPTNVNETGACPSLYVSTIATLSPYRNLGIASALLNRVTDVASRDLGAVTISAHVWEANDEARHWYAKLGFREVKFEPNYYRRLNPPGAWLIEKDIGRD